MREILSDLVAEEQHLDQFLQGLSTRDWKKKTPAPGWTIQDQVSHLAHVEGFAAEVIEQGQSRIDEENITDFDAWTAKGPAEGRDRLPGVGQAHQERQDEDDRAEDHEAGLQGAEGDQPSELLGDLPEVVPAGPVAAGAQLGYTAGAGAAGAVFLVDFQSRVAHRFEPGDAVALDHDVDRADGRGPARGPRPASSTPAMRE